MRFTPLAISLAAGLSTQLALPESKNKDLKPLQFKPDGTFHISVFSDTHVAMCK